MGSFPEKGLEAGLEWCLTNILGAEPCGPGRVAAVSVFRGSHLTSDSPASGRPQPVGSSRLAVSLAGAAITLVVPPACGLAEPLGEAALRGLRNMIMLRPSRFGSC